MRLNFDIHQFMLSQIPAHKRLQGRIKLFWWSLKGIQDVFNRYLEWYNDALFKANATGQTICLEAYLNRFVEGAQDSIYIVETENDGGLWLGVRGEGTVHYAELGERDTGGFEELSYKGTSESVLPVDFRIMAPQSANLEQIDYYVRQFKQAGNFFDIKRV